METPSTSSQPAGRAWAHAALLAALCAALFLTRAATLPLTDPDESRCALIVRHMLRTGDWVVPRLEGRTYFDKPAPFFWLAAAAQTLTGRAELGGRLVAALAGLAGVLATYAFARRLFGPTAGLLAGIVLATSGEYLYLARWYRMDMPFAAAMWLAVWWFWRGEDRRRVQGAGRRGSPWYGFYALCGLATLFKGPGGLVLPVLVVGAYLLLAGRPKRVLELLHVRGILVYLAIAAPWYVAICLREPAYAYEFLVRQNLARYAGHAVGRHAFAGILYVPITLMGLLPWTIYLPGACIRFFPRRWRRRNDEPGTLLVWLAVIVPLLFFMFSSTKMINYILPVYPPLAVMIGALVARWIASRGADRLMQHGVAALFATVLVLPFVPAAIEAWMGNLDAWIAVPAAATVLAACGMWASLRRQKRGAFVGWGMAAVVTGLLYLIAHTAPAGYELMSTRSLARHAQPNATACFWTQKELSFLYYASPEQVVEFDDDRYAPELARLGQMLRSDRPVVCLVVGTTELVDVLAAAGGHVVVVAQGDGRWVLANRRPGPSPPRATASRPTSAAGR
jgi:4-amino-4-deoxy-L-arabinose transferase-like glycosyltransferase